MARDTFAVPATGAGVERMFSKSGRVATWTRARLHSKSIVETMLYKEFVPGFSKYITFIIQSI